LRQFWARYIQENFASYIELVLLFLFVECLCVRVCLTVATARPM
jgi:hypothetical protein